MDTLYIRGSSRIDGCSLSHSGCVLLFQALAARWWTIRLQCHPSISWKSIHMKRPKAAKCILVFERKWMNFKMESHLKNQKNISKMLTSCFVSSGRNMLNFFRFSMGDVYLHSCYAWPNAGCGTHIHSCVLINRGFHWPCFFLCRWHDFKINLQGHFAFVKQPLGGDGQCNRSR